MNMRHKPLRVTLTVAAVLLAAAAMAQPFDSAQGKSRRIQLDDLGRVVRVSDPQISPDGKSIVVVMSRANYDENRYDAELVLVDVASGRQRSLTMDRRGIGQPRFSPSGDRLAFVATVASAAGQPARAQVFVMPMTGGDARRITSAPKGVQQYAWSPDGRSIAVVRLATAHSGDNDRATIQVVDVATGQLRGVTGRERAETQPTFSPDGSQIAYWHPREGDSGSVNEIHVAPAAGGAGRSLTRALDRNAARSIWMPDGKTLLVGANDNTRVSLWLQPLDGPARRLDLGTASPSSSFWVDVAVGKDGAIAFTATDPMRPAELYYMASPTSAPKRLTDVNAEVASLALGKTEVITWKSDNFTHNGILTYPPDFAPGRKYPLVLVIHGGPRAASLETFAMNPQIMAAKGWVVFQPNYRGSDQIGSAYQRAIVNDAGAGPGRDVMAGAEAVKQRGFVDATRIAVSGWSYGGYMTTWLIGNYTGWRVAVAGAAVTDWMDQYNLGDANVRRASAFGGSPWTDPKRMQAFMDQSPIAYASKIRTPTLVMTNTQDYRVPPTQSFKLYHALKDNGVPTKFIGYPIFGHNANDPVRSRDVQRRWIGWIEQYFNEVTTSSSR